MVIFETHTFNTDENPVLTVATNITDTKYCEDETIIPNALGSGGAGGYTYDWDNGLTQGVEGTLPVGNHTLNVTVTDNVGCTATDSKIVVGSKGRRVALVQWTMNYVHGANIEVLT